MSTPNKIQRTLFLVVRLQTNFRNRPCGTVDRTLRDPDFQLQKLLPEEQENVPEIRPNKLVLLAANSRYFDITAYVKHRQSLHRLERIIAYCLRFLGNCKTSAGNRSTGPFSPAELDAALAALIINSQRTYLTAEFNALSRENPVSKSSKIRSLTRSSMKGDLYELEVVFDIVI